SSATAALPPPAPRTGPPPPPSRTPHPAPGSPTPHPGSRTPRSERQSRQHAFVREQPLLAVEAAAIAGERPITADDTMARHDNGDRICAVCGADGTHGARLADSARKIRVRQRGPCGDVPQRFPNPALKRRSVQFDGHVCERAAVTREIFLKNEPDRIERRANAGASPVPASEARAPRTAIR